MTSKLDAKSIAKTLEKNGIKEAAKFQSAYMRNLFPHFGLKTPERRTLTKPLIGSSKDSVDWKFIEECWNFSQRDMQHVALDYLKFHRKQLTKDDLGRLQKLAQEKSWWDTVDTLAGLVGSILMKDSSSKKVILKWSGHENFWVRRLAILSQLLLKDKTDEVLLEKVLIHQFGEKEFNAPSKDGLGEGQNRAFFINKAVGWALRQYAKTNPQWVRDFLKKNAGKLSQLSMREATKHLEVTV